MIITDIEQIDRLVVDTLAGSANVLAVEVGDYALIKEQSASLKLLLLEYSELTRDVADSIGEALMEVGVEGVKNALLLISVGGSGGEEVPLTFEQMQMCWCAVEDKLADSNIIVGLGSTGEEREYVRIAIVLGYC